MPGEEEDRPTETQTAYAKSAFTDPQNIASVITFLLAALALPDIVALIPLKYMPAITAVSALASLWLRTAYGVRPVAAIAPREVKPVEIKRLDKTQQGSEGVTK